MGQPLEGVRVLDLTMFLAGPFAGHLMADLGAQVIKVEPPKTGDLSRRGQGLVPGSTPSAQFIALHRNKQSLTVDLKNKAGREVFYDLVRHADVLLENYRPGVTKRLAVDYETLGKINPRLIYCSVTGFGSDGPLAQKSAFDSTIQAMAGVMTMTGSEDGPPCVMGVYMGDLAAPCFGIHAVLAVLYAREKGGTGCHIDMSMLEGLLYLAPSQTQGYLQSGTITTRHGSGYGHGANARAFETSDGKYVQVMCPYPKFQETLRQIIGAIKGYEQAVQDPRFATMEGREQHIGEYWGLLSRAFKTRSQEEWLRILDEADVPCAPVNTVGEALENPQLHYRKRIVAVDVPGLGKAKTFSTPFKFSNLPEQAPTPPPFLGQHTERVLREVLGYSEERVAALKAAEAI